MVSLYNITFIPIGYGFPIGTPVARLDFDYDREGYNNEIYFGCTFLINGVEIDISPIKINALFLWEGQTGTRSFVPLPESVYNSSGNQSVRVSAWNKSPAPGVAGLERIGDTGWIGINVVPENPDTPITVTEPVEEWIEGVQIGATNIMSQPLVWIIILAIIGVGALGFIGSRK